MSDSILRTKYHEVVFIPSEVSLPHGTCAVTSDGVRVTVSHIGGFMVNEPSLEKYLDTICLRLYDMPWCTVRSAWVSRLGYESNFWHELRLNKA